MLIYCAVCLARMMDKTRCPRCDADLCANTFFYTIARNGYMFGFFCSRDCAQESKHNMYLKGTVLYIAHPPATHKELVLSPDVKILKKYAEELERRKIREKYF